MRGPGRWRRKCWNRSQSRGHQDGNSGPHQAVTPGRVPSRPMREDACARSTRMELHTRVELIDTLLEEADKKRQALHHALAAQERAKEEIQHAGHGSGNHGPWLDDARTALVSCAPVSLDTTEA